MMWPDEWASKWPFNIKTYDSGFKVFLAILLAILFMIPFLTFRWACRTFYDDFKWSLPFFYFETYLDAFEERIKVSGWWKDCRYGMWGVYRGPFGIRIIKKSGPGRGFSIVDLLILALIIYIINFVRLLD